MLFPKKILASAIALSLPLLSLSTYAETYATKNFTRIASFPVCLQIDPACNTNAQTAAEIVAASQDGMTLIYSNSPANNIGFVDITDPAHPKPAGSIMLDGEPTSVAVKGDYVLVGVNTSEDFINVSGKLLVIHIATRALITSIDLGGQPDSVAVSPDGKYAAIAIENERDEDLGDGVPPQAPAGYLVVVNTAKANPAKWTARTVELTGLAELYSGDPEPEFVAINENNIAAVTLQENNHIVLVNLKNGRIVNHFSAGSEDLSEIDTQEEEPAVISLSDSIDGVLREPDGVTWIGKKYFATANEGDLEGGSRGFTIFNKKGKVVFSSGNEMEHIAVQVGHYPDARSENKGNEPENIAYAEYGNNKYLFVNSERSSLIYVYDVANPRKPELKQVLPAAAAPEGGVAIPERNLFVVASEEDSRKDLLRSALNIYSYDKQKSTYPTLQSLKRSSGTPIPWSAISGLSSNPHYDEFIYAVDDSYYASNRIFKISVNYDTPTIMGEIKITDAMDVFAKFPTAGAASDPAAFDALDLAAMINADKTVNIDSEGIAKSADGGFWIASEGSGTMGDAARPIESLNFIFKVRIDGVIEEVIALPAEVNAMQLRFGFEGIAEYNGSLYVAFQRAWAGEANPRIGIYDLVSKSWQFVHYPLDARESPNGGWVGLSEISSLGDGKFLVLERDNQGGPDAAIKRLYQIDLSLFTAGETIGKTLLRDLMADLKAPGGLVLEKIEGVAVMNNGEVYIVSDNDGVDDSSGETQLINLGKIISD